MKLQFTNEQSKRLMACNAFSILETTVCNKESEPCTVSATGVSSLLELPGAL